MRIRDGRCTVVLGTGVYSEGPTLRTAIARKWAKLYDYPLTDDTDLARVARFLNVQYHDDEYAATKLIEELKAIPVPNFNNPDEPYRILAKLPLPVYITANYDDFLEQALLNQHRDVKSDLCRWKKSLEDEPSPFVNGFKLSVPTPVVFHLYGYAKNVESLVLTEDDFFQFLIKVSKDSSLIPDKIQKAITGASLILLGFRLDDWDFRVLFHLLASAMEISTSRTHVSVQISTTSYETPEEQKAKVQAFFDTYLSARRNIRVSWETTENFVKTLREKWEQSGHAT